MSSPDAAVHEARTDEAVHLTFPAETRFLRLARLTAAGLAGDLGFDIEEIEDLRIAVDEACAVLLESAQEARADLDLVYRVVDGALVVEGTCPGEGSGPIEMHTVAREILRMSADEHSLEAADGQWRFTLVKRGMLEP
jgi:serine/threonine-protein kinase RsbW